MSAAPRVALVSATPEQGGQVVTVTLAFEVGCAKDYVYGTHGFRQEVEHAMRRCMIATLHSTGISTEDVSYAGR